MTAPRIALPPLLHARYVLPYYLHSKGTGPKLRIGLLLDSPTELIAPFAACVDHILRSDFASIELLIINGLPQAAPPAAKGKLSLLLSMLRDPKQRPRIAYSILDRWDRLRAPELTAVLSEMDCSEAFSGIPSITVAPLVKGFVHRFPADALATIRSYNLDVLIRFGFNILRGEILESAKYGIWSYHHGDNDYYRGGPPHFWEVFERCPTSGVILQILTEELDNGLVLDKALSSTNCSVSPRANMLAPFAAGTTMLIRNLRNLHERGWDYLRQRAIPRADYLGKRKIYRAPTNLEVAQFAAPYIRQSAAGRIFGEPVYHWRVGLRPTRGDAIPRDPDGMVWKESPRGCYYADPFLHEYKGKLYLFVEELPYESWIGKISCAEVLADGSLGEMRPALETPYHLSYPFVFEEGGEVFMIPETERNRSIEIYRAVEFPYKWKLEKVLYAAAGLDTTLHVQDGVYWFFTSLMDPPGAAPQLFLFHSESLTGEWNFHPQNPISKDVRFARNAGKLFRAEGALIRPNQDCSVRYGYGLHFHRVDALNETQYKETLVHSILPSENSNYHGIHTFNRAGGFETMDKVRLEPLRKHRKT